MITNRLQWKIGGEAGFGIMTIGFVFSKICTRGGLRTFAYPEYPSLIRGGNNTYQIVVDADQATSQRHEVHLLACLNKETFVLHKNQLTDDAAIIYDPADFNGGAPESIPHKSNQMFVPVPMSAIVQQRGGIRVERNTIALGASFGLLGYPFHFIEEVLADWFGKKKAELARTNIELANIGYEAVVGKYKNYSYALEPVVHNKLQMVVSGNRAIAMGALKAGMKFYAAYPMTPSSEILGYLARQERTMNIVVKHTEDEIAAINMAIGAAFAGVRAMTGTSGGGFALMVEALGMAGIAEVPIVIVMGQRPGPSTGMPTWTAQGDLRFVLHASQGEYPVIVLSPGDVTECFYLAFTAHNLAEKYQLPVILLVDKYVQESWQSVAPFNTESLQVQRGKLLTQTELDEAVKITGKYLRYQHAVDGVSARVLPGMPSGRYIASSYEHDETSFSTEDAAEVTAQMDKRFSKLNTFLANDVQGPEFYGEPDAQVTIVGWGSTKLPALEALRLASQAGITLNYLHFTYIQPLPVAQVQQAFSKIKQSLIVEGNKQGMLAGWIKQHTGIVSSASFNKYNGRPFYPEELVAQAKQLLNK